MEGVRTGKYIVIVLFVCIAVLECFWKVQTSSNPPAASVVVGTRHWLLLHRKSNREYLYQGIPGDKKNSVLIKEFIVKTGIAGERPTPKPELLGREYWLIVDKFETAGNPETAPYFLTLDIPVSEEEPYGPVPYTECEGQCNWQLPGAFGLHGVASDESRLAFDNPGSSGCIRHRDEDIAYLYHILNPQEEIRYYVQDT